MEQTGNRVALIGIIVENKEQTPGLNEILHEYGEYIIGRMGIPHTEEGVAIISVAVSAPGNVISALSGKIGMLKGISSKVIYAPESTHEKALDKATEKAQEK